VSGLSGCLHRDSRPRYQLSREPSLPRNEQHAGNNNYSDLLNPTTGVPGWTTTPGDFLEVWCNVFGNIPASAGTNQLEINALNTDQTVSQVVTNLSTNCPTEFCFDYTGRFGLVTRTYNNDFTMTLSGGYSLSVPLDPGAYTSGGWLRFCTNFVPISPTITIAFRGHPHSTANGAGGAHIDNVALTQCCPPCPPSPILNVARVGSNIVISWSGTGYHLECASLLSKPNSATVWGNLGASSPVTLPLSGGGQKFFRLVCP